jgi:hypothetical protein
MVGHQGERPERAMEEARPGQRYTGEVACRVLKLRDGILLTMVNASGSHSDAKVVEHKKTGLVRPRAQ